MATINIQTASLKEAKNILSKVYNTDKSAVFADNKKAVHSSTLLARIENENQVNVSSNYFTENSLNEMFNK